MTHEAGAAGRAWTADKVRWPMSSLGGALPRHAAQFDHVSELVEKGRRGARKNGSP